MNTAAITDRIIRQAKHFGAHDAGVCQASDLLNGPTHKQFPLPEGVEDHHSILVFALSHPPEIPSLDYYIIREGARYGNSEGNKQLMEISDRAGKWLNAEGLASLDLHYYVEMGGVFLKGAAVLAGLGTIGVNNLLIHPDYGSRIRLRARLVEEPLTPCTPLRSDPCTGCDRPCLDVCPAQAFDKDGYIWERCRDHADHNAAESVIHPADGDYPATREHRCCRMCEISCSYIGKLEQKRPH